MFLAAEAEGLFLDARVSESDSDSELETKNEKWSEKRAFLENFAALCTWKNLMRQITQEFSWLLEAVFEAAAATFGLLVRHPRRILS